MTKNGIDKPAGTDFLDAIYAKKEEEKQKVTPKPVEESSPAPATPVTLRPSGGGLRPGHLSSH